MTVFKNFNDLKLHLFPKLVQDERMQELRKDIKKYARHLANESFDRVMTNHSKTQG